MICTNILIDIGIDSMPIWLSVEHYNNCGHTWILLKHSNKTHTWSIIPAFTMLYKVVNSLNCFLCQSDLDTNFPKFSTANVLCYTVGNWLYCSTTNTLHHVRLTTYTSQLLASGESFIRSCSNKWAPAEWWYNSSSSTSSNKFGYSNNLPFDDLVIA